MKTVVNRTQAPIRIPLPRGKVLHLGPGKKGQISHKDVEHEPLKRLVEAGQIEIEEESLRGHAERRPGQGPHEETHGHHPQSGPQVKGDR